MRRDLRESPGKASRRCGDGFDHGLGVQQRGDTPAISGTSHGGSTVVIAIERRRRRPRAHGHLV